jgi:hypothetical protein
MNHQFQCLYKAIASGWCSVGLMLSCGTQVRTHLLLKTIIFLIASNVYYLLFSPVLNIFNTTPGDSSKSLRLSG